jgi:Uma2 family endonuclease
MIAEAVYSEVATYYELVTMLPPGAEIVFHNVPWEAYEELLEQVGEASSLRISYNDGKLKVMSLSSEHEKYVLFINCLVAQIRVRLRLNILFFGSATMRKRKNTKGNEPDACFYVQTANVIGNRIHLDFAVDPPPDVVVEVDVHHRSEDNDSIYATLGVAEIWRYDERTLEILHLHGSEYIHAQASLALPMLTDEILTEYITRMKQEGEFVAILAFDEWLQTLPQ